MLLLHLLSAGEDMSSLPAKNLLKVAVVALTIIRASNACNLGMLHDVTSITPICCGGEEAADCSEGFPARCSPSCASLIVPFYDDCGQTMALMGPGFFTFDVQRAPPLLSRSLHA